jgi:hypothetical protein
MSGGLGRPGPSIYSNPARDAFLILLPAPACRHGSPVALVPAANLKFPMALAAQPVSSFRDFVP